MRDKSILSIIQYNVNKSKDKVQQHFLQLLNPLKHHIVALQEPWLNPNEKSTINHPAYHLNFPGGLKSRTCIYISKSLAIGKWRKENVPQGSEGDITSISLETDLVAEQLIETLGDHEIELILPISTITWKSRGSQSTLDLSFDSKALENKVIECQPADDLEASSDHIPISTQLHLKPAIEAIRQARPQWKKADWDEVNKRLALQLLEKVGDNNQLKNREAIDRRLDTITNTVKDVVKTLIPRTKPSEFSIPYWTKECSEAVKQARKARRYWTQFKTEGSWIEYQKATNNKKRVIKKAKMIGWRAIVSEATNNPSKIWKLAKWAKKDSEERNRLPQVLDIQDKEGNVWIEDTDKARVMAQHFFPLPVQAEIQDIAGTIYPEELAIIPSTITEAEVEEAIGKLPSDKAPGPDEIPNRLLKECRKTLSKALVELFNGCLSLGYDTPKAYRPIALLNTMGKLLEKLIAKRISRTAETHHLLPEEQMGARPNRSTVTAIEMLTEEIQTTWGRDKKRVTSLLSLDISGAFDNVSHQRLIHNLRLKGIPKWITRFIASFLEGRTTSVVLNSFKSEQIPTCTGIPQGSSLSPILFLFFASTLLPLLQTPSSSAVGFVDDTNIITWSETTEENYRQLAQLHEVCLLWARRHGVKFAPEKY
ncbi:hypothetical protein K3495_g2839 [Podosphaera aphanis]|nr:hypothetical protein K3495_g2839 [Podosphaera aphanis]